jgi:hypothetical protein
MTKAKVIGSLMVGFGILAFGFNNCSKVDFEAMPEKVVAAQTLDDGTVIDQGDVDDLITRLPPGEVDTLRPITDLENDPTLFDTYKCPDSDGVVICHFPNEVEASATKCVGRPAVSSHYDHIRTYVSPSTNQSKTISDYLGPCRFPL